MNFDIQTWIPEAEMPSDPPPPIAVGENLWDVPEGPILHRVWFVLLSADNDTYQESCSCWRFEKWRCCRHIAYVQQFLSSGNPIPLKRIRQPSITEAQALAKGTTLLLPSQDHRSEINRLKQITTTKAEAAFHCRHGSDSRRKATTKAGAEELERIREMAIKPYLPQIQWHQRKLQRRNQ